MNYRKSIVLVFTHFRYIPFYLRAFRSVLCLAPQPSDSRVEALARRQKALQPIVDCGAAIFLGRKARRARATGAMTRAAGGSGRCPVTERPTPEPEPLRQMRRDSAFLGGPFGTVASVASFNRSGDLEGCFRRATHPSGIRRQNGALIVARSVPWIEACCPGPQANRWLVRHQFLPASRSEGYGQYP